MNKINKKEVLSLISAILLVLAHVAIILLSTYVFRYYNMYPKVFTYIFIIIICLFIIIDIVFFIGLKHQDLIQKAIVCVISIMLLVGGCYGTYIMSETNKLVNNVVQVGDDDRYETISGVFVSYKNEKFDNYDSTEQMKNAGEFKLGTLVESSEDSITAAAIQELDNAGVTNYLKKAYANNTDLLFALINEEIDVAVFSSMYQAIFKADENVDYTQYLTNIHEIDNFDKNIVVQSNTSKKDLSKDPFNVLLIGWSPVIGSTTIGLADAIIVASVNPQTYTVSMMSIARDSYVPIACYGGESDKINSGRGTSMDCFVKTVEDLIDEEIDFYMEVDFTAFADLCGHFGGIEIDNPVDFELDGVFVPAGHYIADGWQALEFARERHHMPNGDFDRQQHQKEVIMKLAEQFLKHSLSDALEIFNYISNRLNTNMTLSQLTSMFNMLTSTKNYTGLSLFNLLDMHALRITGYADWHYNDTYELPLWIYRLYQGSIDESLDHMQEVLGNYKSIDQEYSFSFSIDEPYAREPFFSLSYNEEEYHETLPAYYINLTSKTYDEVVAWAKDNGVTLNVTFIKPGDSDYDETLDGMVISQSVPYGKKVSKYPTCDITVMGNGTVMPKLPDNYEGWSLEQAKVWCDDRNYKRDKVPYYVEKDSKEQNLVYKMELDDDKIIIYYYVFAPENSTAKDGKFTCNDGYTLDSANNACKLTTATVPDWVGKDSPTTYGETSAEYKGISYTISYENHATIAKNKVISQSVEAGTSIDVTTKKVDLVVSKGPECQHEWGEGVVTKAATCLEKGTKTYTCSKCGDTKTEDIDKIAHTWSTTEYIEVPIAATCEHGNYVEKYQKCSVCGEKGAYVSNGPDDDAKTEHSYGDWTDNGDGTWTRICSVCGEPETTSTDPSA